MMAYDIDSEQKEWWNIIGRKDWSVMKQLVQFCGEVNNQRLTSYYSSDTRAHGTLSQCV